MVMNWTSLNSGDAAIVASCRVTRSATATRLALRSLKISMPTAGLPSILRVESSLEDALFRQFQPADGHAELTDETPTPRDLSDGVQALYRESLVDLARVKQAVDGFLKAGGGSDLPKDLKSTRLNSSH